MSTAAETGVLLAAAATVDEGPLRLRNKRDESDLTAKEARRLHPEAAPSAPAAAADGEPPVPGAGAEADVDEELTPERKVRKAKRLVRSELSVSRGDWRRRGHALGSVLSTEDVQDRLPRVDVRRTPAAEFVQRYEAPGVPCILTHVMDDWPAAQPGGEREWTWANLRRRFDAHKFKVGSDDDGYAVRMKFHYFAEYALDPTSAGADDSPLYIFDGTFGDRDGSKPLLADYSVPAYFDEDLFQHVGERRRPPYRWVVFGPARSGSSLHIDPLATSAWNALVAGHKRWCLFPPGVPRAAVRPRGEGLDSEVTWFTVMLPRIRRQMADGQWPYPPPVECIQGPGETMFVPGGWWHAVLNVSHTLAVTQNYCSTSNFPKVWRHTRKARPKMAPKWLEALREARSDLGAVADAINAAPDRSDVSESSPSSSSSSTSGGEGSGGSSGDEGAARRGGRGEGASPSRKRSERSPKGAAASAADEEPPKRVHTQGEEGAAEGAAAAAVELPERGASWRRRRADGSVVTGVVLQPPASAAAAADGGGAPAAANGG